MKNENNLFSGLLTRLKSFSDAKGTQASQKNRKRNKLRSLIVEQLEGRRLLASIDLAALGVQGVTLHGAAVDDSSGFSVSGAGDVNGDGYDDVIIGAKFADRTATDPSPEASLAGKSYVVFGGPSLPSTIDLASLGANGFRILGANANDYSGFSVTAIGDVNGDGKDDLAVSSPFADVTYQEEISSGTFVTRNRDNAGQVYVVYGRSSPTLANTTIDLGALGTNGFRIFGSDAFDQTGFSVAGAGDFNGDGLDDFAIGTPDAAGLGNLKASSGDTYIIFGTTAAPSASIGSSLFTSNTLANTVDLLNLGLQGIKIHGADIDDRSGYSVSLSGDLNGDGFDDLVIGAGGGDGPSTITLKQLAGEAYVVFGGKSVPNVINLANLGTPSGAAGSKIFGAAAYDGLGYSSSVVGDVNGDGVDDLLIGARFATAGGDSYAGLSYLLFGSASLAASIDLATVSAGVTFLGEDVGDESGASVRGAGDINGDGYNDLIIGAPNGDASANSKSNAGESYLLFGGPSLPATIDLSNIAATSSPATGVTIWGATNDDKSGTSIDSAGDVNGDGFDDLIIGAPSAEVVSPARAGAGESYIIYGGNGFTSSALPINISGPLSENITGTAGAEVMIGGGGNDGLDGFVGADVLIGGQGNDSLIVSSTTDFRRLVGGTGHDTLVIAAGGLTLNLSSLSDNRIQGIEAINLTGTGNNTLLLNQRDVLKLSDESNTLIIHGNAGDKVSTLGWTFTSSELISPNFFNVYTQGNATLKVQDTITFQAGLDLGALSAVEGTTIVGSTTDDLSGFSVSNAGDINGDGYEDIILGAHQADPSTLSNAGASYIIFGSASPNATINLASANIKILGAASNNLTGQSVSGAGDVNGDGYDDFIVGAPGESASTGKSYVFFGSASPAATIDLASATPSMTISGAAAGELSGVSVSSAGDFNGDGFGDLLVGADNATTSNGAASGRTTLIYGSAAPPSSISLGLIGANGFSIIGGAASDNSGRSVSAAGDLNNDGFDDIVIGAENADNGANANVGKTYVIFGSATPITGPIDLATLALPTGIIFTGEVAGDLSGTSVSNAGDIDGDGYEDLIIGARASDPYGRTDAGKSYVVFGGPSLGSINLSSLGSGGFSILGAANGNATGVSVSVAGDVNGDGYDDLIIGADLANPNGRTGAGESYLLFGSPTRPSSAIDLSALSNGLVILGGAIDDRSGHSVSQAGDVNGDGYDDLLIGAFQADDGANSNVGKAYILYGRNFTDSVTHEGSSAAETINGTSAANVIVAGGGSDTVVGNGGLDVIVGGQGDDIITVTSTVFRRIDGGTGNDTLRFDGENMLLDLTTLSSTKLFDIETIDITGSGNNTLTVNGNDVRNLSATSNTLRVRKNLGDTVNRVGVWTQDPNLVEGSETFEVFKQGAATLLVQLFAQPTITVTATTRAYDGTVFVATSSLTGSIAPTPTVSYEYFLDPSGFIPTSAPKNAGEYYVRAVSAANGSNAAGQSDILGFSITPKALTATGGVGVNRVYDGTTSAQVTRTLTGVVSGDTVVGTSTGVFASAAGGKNVGVNKQITSVSNVVTLSGPDAANYTVGTSNTTNRSATVTAKPITGTAVAASRFYDGTNTTSVVLSLQGFVSGDVVSGSGIGTFTDANVGDLKPVTVSGEVLSGTDALNYTLSPVADTVATISKRLLTATATVADKVYDRTTTAAISYTNLSNFVGAETVTITSATATFDTIHVGANKPITAGTPVLADGVFGGLAANYSLPAATGLTADITPKALTVLASTAASRAYNGLVNATVTVSNANLSGIVSGDTGVTGTAAGTFADKNVGTGKTVTVGTVTLAGTNSTNYTVGAAPNTTANITAKSIVSGNVVSRTGQNKQYDGNTTATVVIGFADGVIIAGDDFLATATRAFSSSAVGTNKTITALSNTPITKSGADAGNYSAIPNLTGAVSNADITKRMLTATATAANKVYDSNLNASVSIVLGNIVGTETVTGTASGTFDTKDVGTGKTVTIGAITLAGTHAGNYDVGSAAPTTADITPASISSITGITANNKVYDATTAATLVTTGASFTGIIGSDTLTVATSTGNFVDKNAANGKTVNITGLTLGGSDAGNYTLVSTTASTTANITSASIIAITGITANNKVFDGNTTATLVTSGATFVGKLGSDDLTVATATGNFIDPNVGNGKTVNITGLTLGGADAGNYSLGNNTATTTANILASGSVVNTQLFYRAIGTNSAIGNATNPTTRIDPNKLALQPGQTEASIEAAPGGTANFIRYYSGFIAGINGLVVDIANTVGIPTASDFQFRTWNGISGSPATSFVLTAATPTVTNLGLVGQGGSRRMKIEFADNAIKNTWLQVTVLANPATTGLSAPNVFYFGSAAGDVGVGNSQSIATGNFWQVTVTGTDGSAVLANQTAPGGASIGNNFDVGKNLGVSGTDRTQILSQAQGPVLRFFNAPAPPPSMMMSSGDSGSSSLAPMISSPSIVTKRIGLVDQFFEDLGEDGTI